MKLNLVTLDFETFFSVDYSLRKKIYNTSSYIRDPQFEATICSIKEGKKKAKTYWGKALEDKFKSMDWGNIDLVCHHAHFDGAILAWHYGIVPRRYIDTLSMSRALHPEYASKSLGEIGKLYGLGGKYEEGEVLDQCKGLHLADIQANPLLFKKYCDYCDRDVELTYEIAMKQLDVFPEDELELVDLTVRMFTQPTFELDVPMCEKALDEATRERQLGIAIGLHQIGSDDAKDLTSNDRFAAALRKLGVEPPVKISKYNGDVTYAMSETDEDFIELLEHEDERVVRLVQGRLAAKSTISETRAARLLEAGTTGAVPVYLNYYGAKTGRWSGGNKLNFQNFPRGSALRRALRAPKGHVVVVADSAQIEARGVNWVANNQSLLDVFRRKQDVYSHTASGIYGRTIDKEKDPDERFIGKVATLGLGYGMGAKKFQTTLKLGTLGPPVSLTINECSTIVKKFRKANAPIEQYWKAVNGILARIAAGDEGEFGVMSYDADGLWLPNGMGILYPLIKREVNQETGSVSYKYYSKNVWKKLYGGLVTENIVQALASVIIRQQMLEYNRWLKTLKLKKGEVARIVTMTHDEIVSIVPARYADKALKECIRIMSTARDWCPDIPLGAEGDHAENYSK